MMNEPELRAIDRTDRDKRRLNAALALYRELIRPDEQNPEKQILHWIDNSKRDLTDEFRCFAIQRNDQVIGFFQYSYFREENLFFLEYLCIRDSEARGIVPTAARRQIERLLAENYPSGFTIVFEVAHKRLAPEQWKPDDKRVKYFQRLGFRKVDFDYRYPVLRSYDGQTSFPADLLIMLPDDRKTVSSSEMRTILRSVYFKHYLRWDRPFLDPEQFGRREQLINALYTKTVTTIGGDNTFGTSGDDRRSRISKFLRAEPGIGSLLEKIFGSKLPRMAAIVAILLFVQATLVTAWLFVPFVLAVAAIYCLAEDTPASRQLFLTIITRLVRTRQQA